MKRTQPKIPGPTTIERAARKLRGEATETELVEFFEDRDRCVRKYADKIPDFLRLSPMTLPYKYSGDPEPERFPLSKRERATRKGRRIEAERREGRRTVSESWNGGKVKGSD